MKNAKGIAVFQLIVVCLLLVIVGLLAYPNLRPARPAKFETEFQAVLLTGGQVYFGKLEGFGTPFPVLREVYYVQQQVNPETKAMTSILIQRGKEWHGPDRMYLNPGHIILIEPVSSNSKVAQLIAEAKKQP